MDIIQLITKNRNKINHDIYANKIFLKITNDIDNIDKLTFIESINNTLNKRIERYIQTNDDKDYNLLENDYNTVVNLLDELKEDVINKQKLPCAVMLDNMKLDEITSFYNLFNKVYSKYQNIFQASSDIFYHSGYELSSYVTKLVRYIKTHEIENLKFIPLKYLEEHATIITLDLKNWLILIKNIKTTMKYLNNLSDDVINELRKELELLNVYYFIVIDGGEA